MPGEGSVLSGIDRVTANGYVDSQIAQRETESSSDTKTIKTYTDQQKNLDQMLADGMDGSTRLIGAPHQFLPHNDNRYGNSEMGRMYAEKIIMEAPTVYIQPGVSEFLPGENSKERSAFTEALVEYYSGADKDGLLKKLQSTGDDVIQYFGIKEAYSEYMGHVNLLCRMLAVFLGIADTRVPWVGGNVKFSNYDWRCYRMKSQYGKMSIYQPPLGFFDLIGDFFDNIQHSIETDYEFIQFYITPDASYSQSFSNSTTSSVIENMTDQLGGIAKELQVVSSMSGEVIGDLAERSAESLNSYIEENASNGPIGTLLKRITGGAKQIINGGNFVLPEIWNNSSTDGSFSFKVHLVTPYGNKLAWYINVGVPLMFLIALTLPLQQTANVIGSPYLLKCFSPGWFTSSMCIVDNMSIEKASDGIWNKAGLPNDVTVSIGLKDLYSSLSLPKSDSIGEFMANTGMLEFLMTTAGVNLSHQELDVKWKVWKHLFQNKITSFVQDNAYDASMFFKHHASGIFKLLK